MRFLVAARNRTIGVENGLIVEAEGMFDTVLAFPDADVRPGLINAHDHLHRNHYGRLGSPPYRNAYEWAADIQDRHRERIAAGRRMARRDALLIGAWKNLFAGVTTVIHHDAWETDFDVDFPLRVLRVPSADSLGMTPDLARMHGETRFCLHLAEGTDPDAANEIRALDAMGLLTSALIAVHCVGLDQDGIGRFRAAGAALLWCPTSNAFLLGRSAPAALLEGETDVLIGSDSLLSGSGDLLDELRCARGEGWLSDERIVDAVGATAARRLGIPTPSLDPGAPADLVVLSRPLLEASARDVLLVIVGGVPRVAHPQLTPRLEGLAPEGRETRIGSVVRWTSICASGAPNGRQ